MKKKTHSAYLSMREQDPYLKREQQRYEHPLPSREWIMTLLEREGTPIQIHKLAKQLSITADEYDFFERRIHAMARDGQVVINRRGAVCMAEKLAVVKCRIEAHKDGFGFAVPLNARNRQEHLVLYERQMRGLMHGDVVMVRPVGVDRRGRTEGQVLDIVERAIQNVVGRFYLDRGVAILEAEDKRLSQPILLDPESVQAMQPKSGQVVCASIIHYPEEHRWAMARLTEVLGDYADSGMEIEIAVRKHQLPHRFSDACLQQADGIADEVQAKDYQGRIDLRALPLLTIDGETARDFDDAVYAEKVGRNYRLVVAIADVSHYVQANDAIDLDAYQRSTSVYFPRRVIPMLPEKLSNGICSLNPNVERLCMVCDMVITHAGNIKSYQFYPAVMKSHARLTYQQVWDWLADGTQDYPHQSTLNTLYQLFKRLHKKRLQRGAMEFETPETQMLFNEQGKIEQIIPVKRNDAHKMIEECMLAANVCAADFLLAHKHTALFRNHLGPTAEKLEALKTQLALLGLQLQGGEQPTPKHYAELATQFEDRADKALLQTMLLRSMRQAVYEPENVGHFGLAYEAYTHFTSPIRRYPDLMVHRAIKAILRGKHYQASSWQDAGVHTSFCERRADEASRDVENWLKTYYMRDKVGEMFSGKISGVANCGVFVTLDDIHIEGMIHISELGEDYFHYRPETLTIEGERSGIQFSMGDALVVKVARADLDTSKIDLTLITGGKRKKRGKKAEVPSAPVHSSKPQKTDQAGVKAKVRRKSKTHAKATHAKTARKKVVIRIKKSK